MMKEITKKYKVYEFNELSKETQNKLIEELQEKENKWYCQDSNCLERDMISEAKVLLQKYFGKKAEFINVCYDLTYSQGSGAMIEFNLEYYNNSFKIRNYGHYCHERSFSIIPDYYVEITDKQEEKLNNKIIKMNTELAKTGYKMVEWKPSREESIDYLSQFEYLENGEVFE